MRNPIQKFGQSSIAFEKPGILSENLDFHELEVPNSSIFCAETSHTFPTYQCLQKGVRNFLFCVDLELFAKDYKDLVSTHSFLHFY